MPGVWRPIFSFEELPGQFSGSLRRPIANEPGVKKEEKQNANTGGLFLGENGDDAEEGVIIMPGADSDAEVDEETGVFFTSSNAQPNGPKRLRMAGGVPPVRKKAVLDMDSDDEIIYDMKTKGYKDAPISERLIQEGRTRYDPKTIATRFQRIRKVVKEAEEDKLEVEFDDFHQIEDKYLHQAVEEAQEEYEKDLAKVEDRHWEHVVELMKAKMGGQAKYTKRLARERWQSLEDGTAIPPFEQDPDQAGRIERAKAAQEERKHLKEERDAAKIEEIMNRQRRKEDKRLLAEERANQKEEDRLRRLEAREAEKASKQETRAAAKAEKEAAATRKAEQKVEAELARQVNQKKKADKRAEHEWKARHAVEANQRRIAEVKLLQIGLSKDEYRQEIEEMRDDFDRVEIIRRAMRGAGADLAAPREKFDIESFEKTKEARMVFEKRAKIEGREKRKMVPVVVGGDEDFTEEQFALIAEAMAPRRSGRGRSSTLSKPYVLSSDEDVEDSADGNWEPGK